jgi:hypothetical protein
MSLDLEGISFQELQHCPSKVIQAARELQESEDIDQHNQLYSRLRGKDVEEMEWPLLTSPGGEIEDEADESPARADFLDQISNEESLLHVPAEA